MAFNIRYNVTHIQQSSPMACWSAVVSMMLGSNFTAGPGGATLAPDGGLPANHATVEALARSYGLSVAPPSSWNVSEIARFLANGPIGLFGVMPRRHAIVISGLVGDGTPNTKIYVHDPFRATGPLEITYQTLMTGGPPGALWAPTEYILYR